MACARTVSVIISVLSFSAIAADAQWRYETTDDGAYRVGRNGPNVSVETDSFKIRFSIPTDWPLSHFTADEFGCKFSAGWVFDGPSLEFSIERKLPGVVDPNFKQRLLHAPSAVVRGEAPFSLPDGRRLIPHHDIISVEWSGAVGISTLRHGAALYLFVSEQDYACSFNFTGNRLLKLPISREIVQKILDSYIVDYKKPSNHALESTAIRREIRLSMIRNLNSHLPLDFGSGDSAWSR